MTRCRTAVVTAAATSWRRPQREDHRGGRREADDPAEVGQRLGVDTTSRWAMPVAARAATAATRQTSGVGRVDTVRAERGDLEQHPHDQGQMQRATRAATAAVAIAPVQGGSRPRPARWAGGRASGRGSATEAERVVVGAAVGGVVGGRGGGVGGHGCHLAVPSASAGLLSCTSDDAPRERPAQSSAGRCGGRRRVHRSVDTAVVRDHEAGAGPRCSARGARRGAVRRRGSPAAARGGDGPGRPAGGLGLVSALARQPLWWAGSAADVAGYAAQAAALGLGSLLLVQPLLVTSLLFALPLGARWSGRTLRRADRNRGRCCWPPPSRCSS